jgi:hypothetical protein
MTHTEKPGAGKQTTTEDDLVARLRARKTELVHETKPSVLGPDPLLIEAADEIERLLDCNLETGEIKWRVLGAHRRKRVEGKQAGRIERYRKITINGRDIKACHLIWFLAYGVWPKKQIDHINTIKTDDKISNLREATNTQNQMNRKPPANSTGFPGVKRQWNRFSASMRKNGKPFYLGSFGTPQEAAEAYRNAVREHHGEFARL